MNRNRQRGATTVEFAIIGLLAMVVMLSLIEFSRLVFTLNALSEATRRGARMAAVCPINDPAIAQVAAFNAPGDGGASAIVNNLTTGNVVVEYLSREEPAAPSFEKIEERSEKQRQAKQQRQRMRRISG